MRVDGRHPFELRKIKITSNYTKFAEGSVLFAIGDTHVLCNATIEEDIPYWMKKEEKKGGWVTAEYAMLPRATHERTRRENFGLGGRTQEIKRLIGRSLRMAVDLTKLGHRTCIIDCDVLQADGGTRTASITGGYLALALAIQKLIDRGAIPPQVLVNQIAAISVGVLHGTPLLDLNYAEDRTAEVDANIVMNGQGHYIEIQTTAEQEPFSNDVHQEMLKLANQGIAQLFEEQRSVLDKMR